MINNIEKNIQYKKKYLKYKNKFYKLKGGALSPIATSIIISVLLLLLSTGGYILYNQFNNNTQVIKYTFNKKTIVIDFRKTFIEDLNKLFKNNIDVNEYLDKYFKYANIDILLEINNISNKIQTKTNENNITDKIQSNTNVTTVVDKIENTSNEININTIILNHILKNKLYSPFKLINIKNIEQLYTNKLLPDTLIICLLDIIKNNINYFNFYSMPDYNRLQKDLLNYIEENSSFNKYFEKNKDNIDPLYYKYLQYMNTNKLDNKINSKNDYIKYMKTNEDVVSDIPMIHAAAEYFRKYIIVKMVLTTGTYFKVFKPINNIIELNVNLEDSLERSVIFLEYINLCDHYCDFVKEFNYSLDKNIYKNKNIKNKIYADTTDVYSIDNIENIDSKVFTEKNNLELDITKNNYFDKNKLNNLIYDYNLISEEKIKINKNLSKRPYYQYYKLYNKQEILEINKYIHNLLI